MDRLTAMRVFVAVASNGSFSATADQLEMDLFRSESRLSERDLSKSLSNGSVRRDERPWVTLRFNLPSSERAELRELGSEMDDFRLDFPVRFARDLVGQLPRVRRQDQLTSASAFIEKVQQAEIEKVTADLQKLSVDFQVFNAKDSQRSFRHSV